MLSTVKPIFQVVQALRGERVAMLLEQVPCSGKRVGERSKFRVAHVGT